MNDIKEIAECLLNVKVVSDERFPFIVHHPFFDSLYFPVNENGKQEIKMITDKEVFKKAKQIYIERINEADEILDFVGLIRKPYLGLFTKMASKYLSEEDLGKLLKEVWILIETHNFDVNVSVKDYKDLFKKTSMKHLMSFEEMEAFEKLPETFIVYRGVLNDGTEKGLSWTTDKKVAEWFSNRFDENNGRVYSGTVNKHDIFAYFLGRNESEIVIDWQKISNLALCE